VSPDFIRQQRDHCFAQEAVSEGDRITMWALGGFVPDDPTHAIEFLRSSPLFKQQLARVANIEKVIPDENSYRLELVDKMNKWLEAMLASAGHTRKSCRLSGLNKTLLDELKARVPTFAKLCDDVFDAVTDDLEEAGFKRAVHGVEETVYWQGEKCGTKKVYSDGILTMMLAGRRSAVYRRAPPAESVVSEDVARAARDAIRAAMAEEE